MFGSRRGCRICGVEVCLRDPADVLRRMSDALRPGGWLVTEEIDNAVAGSVDSAHPLAEAFDACYRQRIEFALDTGVMDLCFGRALPGYVEALGFEEVGYEGVAHTVRGGVGSQAPSVRTHFANGRPLNSELAVLTAVPGVVLT